MDIKVCLIPLDKPVMYEYIINKDNNSTEI